MISSTSHPLALRSGDAGSISIVRTVLRERKGAASSTFWTHRWRFVRGGATFPGQASYPCCDGCTGNAGPLSRCQDRSNHPQLWAVPPSVSASTGGDPSRASSACGQRAAAPSKHLSRRGTTGRDISVRVARRGIVGLAGAGRRPDPELCGPYFGLDPIDSGRDSASGTGLSTTKKHDLAVSTRSSPVLSGGMRVPYVTDSPADPQLALSYRCHRQ